ncbi:hypothetical protein Gotri_012300 [Gossypium trilobum]|uniref:Protein kinase domain-containing protein n=1 Tax=Gossypium trilobum TaxID=34281 RepID=A0A7J9DPR1_9ROSI|nr:hypothetical protein [Gossypium trilobum]
MAYSRIHSRSYPLSTWSKNKVDKLKLSGFIFLFQKPKVTKFLRCRKQVKMVGKKEHHLWKKRDLADSGQKALNLVRIVSLICLFVLYWVHATIGLLQLSPFYIYAQAAQECSLLAGERFNEIVGSSYYMAPEVLKCNYGLEADVWSAGVIVFILLCGVPPFWAKTEQGVAQAIIRSVIDFKRDPWPKVSDNAKDLVKKMLNPDPKQRLTAQEVLGNLL